MGTGAYASLIGRSQAESYCKMMGILFHIENDSKRIYRFGSQRKPSIGNSKLRVTYAINKVMELELDVDMNLPLLLGLHTMDKFNLYLNNVYNLLICTASK